MLLGLNNRGSEYSDTLKSYLQSDCMNGLLNAIILFMFLNTDWLIQKPIEAC